jgi:hypothetical protein
MNFNQTINNLRQLNPGTRIRIGNPEKDLLAFSRIYSSKSMNELVLPEINDNAIFSNLKISPIEDAEIGTCLPEVDVYKFSNLMNVNEISVALQKLNPGVLVRVANAKCCRRWDGEYKTIYTLKPLSDLAIPIYFDDCSENYAEDCITNKNKKNQSIM